jgi:tRNA-dihydrouridine synthase
VKDIMDHEAPYNGLEGVMSGRMAMNTPWEVARIDREVYGDENANTLTREEMILVS